MTPFESDELGLAGVRPEGWIEAVPGVWQESVLTSLVQQVLPGTTADELLEQLSEQFAPGQPLVPVGEIPTETGTWQLYQLDDLGQSAEIALADGPDGVLVIQLLTSPSFRDVHRAQIFLPAVEALAPLFLTGRATLPRTMEPPR